MLCFAAYTGARRSEIVRVKPSDVDLVNGEVTIREKKRVKKKDSTRKVPLSPFLKEVLGKWFFERGEGDTLFCKRDGNKIAPREALNYFQRAVRVSPKWSKLRGLHVFRHSFVSALASKGVDQRTIDAFVGHQTEQQRRRYTHLYRTTKEEAINRAFGKEEENKGKAAG
jgi:integrase